MKTKTPEFDFSSVGKRMPYRTPDGFFEQSAADLRNAVQMRKHSSHRRRWYAVAASVSLLLAVSASIFYYRMEEQNAVSVYCQTDAEQNNEWSSFAEADLFLENMNW